MDTVDIDGGPVARFEWDVPCRGGVLGLGTEDGRLV